MDKIRKELDSLKNITDNSGLFHDNEVETNRAGITILLMTALVATVVMVLAMVGIFPIKYTTIMPPLVQGLVLIMIIVAISRISGYEKWWTKYVLLVGLNLVYASFDWTLTHKSSILIAIPVVFSSRYFSRRTTVYTAVFSAIVFALSSLYGSTNGMVDLNIVSLEPGITMTTTGGFISGAVQAVGLSESMLRFNYMVYNYVPRLLLFSIIAIISTMIAERGRKMILEKNEQDIQASRIDSELETAHRIQEGMLPGVFPPFPERTEFDIFALNKPAKKVGGDLYDFFLIDNDHLAVVIADVSGKGIPAALFMMASMILIRNIARTGLSPAKVLKSVNEAICHNNKAEMFITVWLGILDIRTGILTAANAGHEYPMIKNPDGDFEVLKDRHGLVLGAMEGMEYTEYQIRMEPGSKVFVYTDGLPESNSINRELYGMERSLQTVNRYKDCDPEGILNGVSGEIEVFTQGKERFDDLTMLALQYNGTGKDSINVEASLENVTTVTDFINRKLDEHGCIGKTRNQIDIAIDELFSNIANYAYGPEGGMVKVGAEVETDTRTAVITFTDSGIPFDPLSIQQPDTTSSAENRAIGGLGIFMVRKMMDDFSYQYLDGHNVVTIRKYIGE